MSYQCPCEHCAGLIEFPDELAGQVVICPHCNAETLLPAGEATVEEAVVATPPVTATAVRSKKFLALAVSVVVLGGLGAWAVVAARSDKGASNHSTGDTASSEQPAAASSEQPSSSGDSMKEVKPVIAPYQGGQVTAQIRNGREVFITKCTECHRQYDPASFPGASWDNIMGTMRGKAKLRGTESDDLARFIKSIRNS